MKTIPHYIALPFDTEQTQACGMPLSMRASRGLRRSEVRGKTHQTASSLSMTYNIGVGHRHCFLNKAFCWGVEGLLLAGQISTTQASKDEVMVFVNWMTAF